MQHRVLIVSHHRLFAEGIASLLAQRQDMTVVGAVAAPGAVQRAVRDLHPDVIIVDCKECGLVERVIRLAPQARVVAVTLNDNTLDLYQTTHVEMTSVEDLFAAIDRPLPAALQSADAKGKTAHGPTA
jgi:DNA-binding NarL/FixJ family response regulator